MTTRPTPRKPRGHVANATYTGVVQPEGESKSMRIERFRSVTPKERMREGWYEGALVAVNERIGMAQLEATPGKFTVAVPLTDCPKLTTAKAGAALRFQVSKFGGVISVSPRARSRPRKTRTD